MQDFNYHTHTYRCGHADPSLEDEEYVKLFIKKGFKKICFTDHCPQEKKNDVRNNMRMDYSQKEEYYESIKRLKSKYKDMIEIEVGFEIEYIPELESYLKKLKSETDKLILGQHFVKNDKSKEIKIIGWENTSDEDLLSYARCIEEAMEKGIPNVIAHPDLFMVGRSTFGELEKKATEIIAKAAEKYQVPLEINLTRAALYLNKRTNKIHYPCKEFWNVASNYNIKVVYGVDAHFKEQILFYEDSVKLVNEHIGKEIISKLNFCDKNL
jgi:histidinol-phosphatase (PHP family)